MFDKKQNRYVKRIHLVIDDGLYHQNCFYSSSRYQHVIAFFLKTILSFIIKKINNGEKSITIFAKKIHHICLTWF